MISTTWTILLTCLSTALLLFCAALLLYEWIFRYRLVVKERLDELTDESDGDRELSLFKDFERLQSQGSAVRTSWADNVRRLIEEAGIDCSLAMLIAWSICAGAIVGLAGAWRAWWCGLCLVPVGALLPFLGLLMRRRVRQRKLCRQLPEAFSMISRAVRAGQTVPAAFQIIAEDFDPPISKEFALCYEQQNLGMSRETALRKLAARSGIMELQIFVVALLVQAKSGGDLVELLDNLASMIRKRLKLKDRVRALTGEGRMQAVVLLIMPIAAFLGIAVLAPDYGKTLFERPWLLGLTASAQAAGVFWIRKIVTFDY